MGHRRSHTHTRVSKRGSPEVVSAYPKDKHDTNGEGSKAYDRSRREKRERKRKREHEDSSKKKHKEKYKGKNRHHKTKDKPKDKISRRKDRRTSDNMSLESDSSTSFLSSREACRHHRSHSRSRSRSRSRICSRSWNADLPWERSHSGSADVLSTHRSKRFKENNEAFSMDDIRQTYEPPNDPMQVGLRRCVNAQLVQAKASAQGVELKGCCMDTQQDGCDVSISRNQEQEKTLDGRKDKVLEVELRQKALANFLRRHDVSCKMDENKQSLSPTRIVGMNQPVPKSEQSERAVTDVDCRWTGHLSALSTAVNVDTPVDVCASNMTAHISQNCLREGSEFNSRSNLEEGEISSDNENETGNENTHCLADEGRILHDKENTETGAPQASRNICKEQHELSAGELFTVAATCTNEKPELSQEHAVEGSLNVDPGAARHEIDGSFQQKTMSVMRGGEMVQVNYKVYIPKRAAELARRRLQR